MQSVGAVSSYDFNNINSGHLIHATFAANPYTITFDSNGGTLVPDITQDYGTDVKAPENPTRVGYVFTGWDKQVPPTMPFEGASLKAQWVNVVVIFTYAAGPGGTIDGVDTKSQAFNYGGNTTPVTAVASTGYHFTGWSDGVTSATRSDLNVIASQTVTANFEADEAVAPSITSPLITSGTGDVLGDSDTTPPPVTEEKGEIKGTSDKKNDETNNNTGFMGIAWYWWLTALAGVGGAGWWGFGAFRRRQEEEE